MNGSQKGKPFHAAMQDQKIPPPKTRYRVQSLLSLFEYF